jgi:hypothetical protein
VNLITGYKGLQITVSIWGPSKDDGISYDKVLTEKSDFRPFLDMKMYWNGSDNLTFDVYHKEGQQQIKYLNHDSKGNQDFRFPTPRGSYFYERGFGECQNVFSPSRTPPSTCRSGITLC